MAVQPEFSLLVTVIQWKEGTNHDIEPSLAGRSDNGKVRTRTAQYWGPSREALLSTSVLGAQ